MLSIFDGVNNSDEEFIAFESNQIKSVENSGAFSADDANIYHQSAWHGTGAYFSAACTIAK